MKTSGIARKIDRLGRIVIPKEMRSALRIASGDFVDIQSDGTSITIRKTEVLGRYADIAEAYTQTIYAKIGLPCFICSRDSVISASGIRFEPEHEISDQMRLCILKGKVFYTESQPFVPIGKDDKHIFMQYILPLTCAGEVYGAIVVCAFKPYQLSQQDNIFLSGAGELLCAQLLRE